MADANEQFSQMEATTEELDYITAVFMGFLQPITDLCDLMLRLHCDEPNEVQAAARENGYGPLHHRPQRISVRGRVWSSSLYG